MDNFSVQGPTRTATLCRRSNATGWLTLAWTDGTGGKDPRDVFSPLLRATWPLGTGATSAGIKNRPANDHRLTINHLAKGIA